MYHAHLALQCVNGCSDERGENEGEVDRREVLEERERLEITWALICKGLGFVLQVKSK